MHVSLRDALREEEGGIGEAMSDEDEIKRLATECARLQTEIHRLEERLVLVESGSDGREVDRTFAQDVVAIWRLMVRQHLHDPSDRWIDGVDARIVDRLVEHFAMMRAQMLRVAKRELAIRGYGKDCPGDGG